MTEFKHISVHIVHVVARAAARNAVKARLRDEGRRLSLVPNLEIDEKATAYLAAHPEVWRQAWSGRSRSTRRKG